MHGGSGTHEIQRLGGKDRMGYSSGTVRKDVESSGLGHVTASRAGQVRHVSSAGSYCALLSRWID